MGDSEALSWLRDHLPAGAYVADATIYEGPGNMFDRRVDVRCTDRLVARDLLDATVHAMERLGWRVTLLTG